MTADSPVGGERVRILNEGKVERACRAVVRVSVRSEHEGGSNSVVESQPSKLLVAGSIPVSRSSLRSQRERMRELRLASQVPRANGRAGYGSQAR